MIDFDYVLMLSQRDTDINQHLLLLYLLPVSINAKTIVEIGAGQSTFALSAAANATGGEFYSHDLSSDARLRLFPEGEGVLDKEPRYHFVGGDNLETGKNWNKPIDLLFIDSSHTYEGTRAELDLWAKWVGKGGIICCHDTSKSWVDCRKALDDFLLDKKDEFIRVQYENQNGLTVLRKI